MIFEKGFQLCNKTKMSSASPRLRIFENKRKKRPSRLCKAEYSQKVKQKNLISKKLLNHVLRQKCLSFPPFPHTK